MSGPGSTLSFPQLSHSSTTLPACSVDGRPYVKEDPRLKAWGLVFTVLAAAGAAWLSNHPLADRWLSGSIRDIAIAAAVFVLTSNLALLAGILMASGFGVVRPWRDARGRWATMLLVAAANLSLPILGFGLLQEDATVSGLPDRWILAAGVVALALIIGVIRLYRRSQQWEALSADEALRRDARPPVVYLRAFTDDGQLAVRGHQWQDRVLGKGATLLTLTSPEQELAFILRRVGPVIAIGRPGEPLPELGAARLYASHDSWQRTVLDMVERASMVLVRVGSSPGVLWELDQVLSRAQRSKVVILILGSPEEQAAGVRAIESRLGEPLVLPPPHSFRFQRVLALTGSDPFRTIGILVAFDAAGHPHAAAIPLTTFGPTDVIRSAMMRPFAGPLRAICRPVLARLGHPWRDPPSRLIAVVLAVVFGGFGGHTGGTSAFAASPCAGCSCCHSSI